MIESLHREGALNPNFPYEALVKSFEVEIDSFAGANQTQVIFEVTIEMAGRSIVSIVKVSDSSIDESVNKAIDLIDGFDELKEKENICIKPNLCCPKSALSGYTTDPRIVEAIIKRLSSAGSKIIKIVETNNSQASADRTFQALGYSQLEESYPNTTCVNLSKDTRFNRNLNGEIFSNLLVPETLLLSDCLINVAKLKIHLDYRYTGALKNLYGLLLKRHERPRYHGVMYKALVDLARVYKPDLSMIDAIVGMEGPGPTDGCPKYVGAIIASKDPVAADSAGARVMGIPPSKIKYLRYAEKKGLGTSKNIEVVGCPIEEISTKFKFIPMKYYYKRRLSLGIKQFSMRHPKLARFIGFARRESEDTRSTRIVD